MMLECTPNEVGEICVGAVSDCSPGERIRVRTPRFRVAVFHLAGGFVAIKDHCPHADVSLSRGTLDDSVLTCPAHNWKFDLSSAACVHGGPEECSLRTFPVDVRNEKIWVKISN